jgi:hypothetical protein
MRNFKKADFNRKTISESAKRFSVAKFKKDLINVLNDKNLLLKT